MHGYKYKAKLINNMQENTQIPKQISDFASSADIYIACEKIGQVYNLHIDQISELDNEIRCVLLGKNKSADFTDHIIKNMEISRDVAEKITEEVNSEIFKILRISMQAQTPLDNSALERAGGFAVVPEETSGISRGIEKEKADNVTPSDKNKILSGIENPKMSRVTMVPKTGEGTFTEPMVDRLLRSSTAVPKAQPLASPTHNITATPVSPITPTNLPIETAAENPKIKAMIDHVPTSAPMVIPAPVMPQAKNPPTPTPKLPLQPASNGADLYREAVK